MVPAQMKMLNAGCRTELFAQNATTVFSERRESYDFARDIAELKSVQGDNEPFYVMHMGRVHELLDDWHRYLPRVQPFYAVNCNADAVLLRLLADREEVGFLCTTRENLNVAAEIVAPERLLYANPCWTRGAVGHAKESGVQLMTFDCERDLDRILATHPDADLLLNICLNEETDDPSASLGCEPCKAPELLALAAQLGLRCGGVGFNIGSGCRAPSHYAAAIECCAQLFQVGDALGLRMKMLNIGGGFATDLRAHPEEFASFTEICAQIDQSLEHFFPCSEFPQLRVIANPGRFFAGPAFSLITSVIGKRAVDASNVTNDDFDTGNEAFIYQTNEGYYGSFGCRVVPNCVPECAPLFTHELDDHSSEHFYGSVLGPTSDEFDVVQSLCRFRQLCVGDWLLWSNMGAYSLNNRADMGDVDKPAPTIYYFASEPEWLRICTLQSPSHAMFSDVMSTDATVDSGCCESPVAFSEDDDSVFSEDSAMREDDEEQFWALGCWPLHELLA